MKKIVLLFLFSFVVSSCTNAKAEIQLHKDGITLECGYAGVPYVSGDELLFNTFNPLDESIIDVSNGKVSYMLVPMDGMNFPENVVRYTPTYVDDTNMLNQQIRDLKIGKAYLIYRVEDTDGSYTEKVLKIDIVDTLPAIITFKNDSIKLKVGDKFDPFDNIELIEDVCYGVIEPKDYENKVKIEEFDTSAPNTTLLKFQILEKEFPQYIYPDKVEIPYLEEVSHYDFIQTIKIEVQ